MKNVFTSLSRTFKVLVLSGLALFGVSYTASAQSPRVTASAVSAATPANLLSGRYVTDEIYFINSSSSNTATIKFYDAASAITNIVRPAYSYIDGYSTNYSTVYTNAAGLLATNVTTTWYTYTVSASAVTNERTKLSTVSVPPSGARLLPLRFIVANGLTVLSDQAGTIEVTYRGN